MKYDEFKDYVKQNVICETIYMDTEGRDILVICLLDAYVMTNKLKERAIYNRTDDELKQMIASLSSMLENRKKWGD